MRTSRLRDQLVVVNVLPWGFLIDVTVDGVHGWKLGLQESAFACIPYLGQDGLSVNYQQACWFLIPCPWVVLLLLGLVEPLEVSILERRWVELKHIHGLHGIQALKTGMPLLLTFNLLVKTVLHMFILVLLQLHFFKRMELRQLWIT